jgi:hypothetical protein
MRKSSKPVVLPVARPALAVVGVGGPPPSAIFDFGQHWRVIYDGDAWSAEPVARWDVPGIGDREQPTPVITEQEATHIPRMPVALTRFWRPEDISRCALCPSCGAGGNVVHPELRMCIRYPAEMLAEEDAPLHRTDWGAFPFDR